MTKHTTTWKRARSEEDQRTIAIVTSSRADYMHLFWPLRELEARPDVNLRLIVTGAHLSPEFGETVRVIEADGFAISDRIECLISSDSDGAMARAIGLATISVTDAFERIHPDLLVLIADRFEMMAPAAAAMALRIPIAHIEGGERSEGAIDQAVRDALTAMSHLHLTTTADAAAALIQRGEEPGRVHHVGAASLDHLRRTAMPNRIELEHRLGMDLGTPTIVVAIHPVTLDADPAAELAPLLDVLETVDQPLVFCHPNADASTRQMHAAMDHFCSTRPHAKMFTNLEPRMYWGLLQHAAAIVGNSSSGVMEAASLQLPAVNIGRRQQGRLMPANVLDVPAEADAIAAAIRLATSGAFRAQLADLENPYGDGRAADRIAELVATFPLEGILEKRAPVTTAPSPRAECRPSPEVNQLTRAPAHHPS